MNFRRKSRSHSIVEAGALSDILFFLLLFFLMISTLASPTAIKILLPKASTGQAIPKQIINLAINEKSEYYIEKNQVGYANLENELGQAASNFQNPSVVLRVDQSLPISEVVKVIDVINRLHLPMVVATQKPD